MGESLFIEAVKRWLQRKPTNMTIRFKRFGDNDQDGSSRSGDSDPCPPSNGGMGNGFSYARTELGDVKKVSELGLDLAQNVFGGRRARLWNEPVRDTDSAVNDANRSGEHDHGYPAEGNGEDPSAVNVERERGSPQSLEDLMAKSDRRAASSKGLKDIFLKKKAADPHLKKLLQRHGVVDAQGLCKELREFIRLAEKVRDQGK